MDTFRRVWVQSKVFRTVLIVAFIWFFLRLTFQIIYTAGAFPELTGESGLPADLPVYMAGAQHFQLRQMLYPQDLSDSTADYPYSPPFAMLSEILLWLPARWTAMLSLLLIVLAYILIYLQWMRIFRQLKLPHVEEKMVWLLPVWLIFSPFWGGISYLNIGVIVALATTLLLRCILEERLGWSVLLLAFLFISKIMWAFPLALPLLLGRRRFFLKLVAFTAAAYLALVGWAMLAAGPAYIVQQYGQYFNHLNRLTTDFPWSVWSVTPYFGLNHSVKQTVIFILGDKPWVQQLATLLKLVLLIPLIVVSWRLYRHPREVAKYENPSASLYLELAFILYLGAFIWLDIVWELLLGIVIFTYLLATLEQTWQKWTVWGLFLLYAFLDVIRLVSFAIGGDRVLQMDGEYVLTDPSIYVPLTLFIILLFYAFLVRRVWRMTKDISTAKV